jgi:hypothetical protein
MEGLFELIRKSSVGKPLLEHAIAYKEGFLPKRVYKYRTDSAHSRKNLVQDTVWMASPFSFNDPYDCTFTVTENDFRTALERRVTESFIEGYQLNKTVEPSLLAEARNSSAPLRDLLNEIRGVQGLRGNPKVIGNYSLAAIEAKLKETIEKARGFKNFTKLCCFSEINSSILMWSHYADHHRGFCIEYDISNLDKAHAFRRNLYPVRYHRDLCDLTWWVKELVEEASQEFNPEGPLLMLLHKFDGWEYEREWRMVKVSTDIESDHCVGVPTPIRIYLGAKFLPSDHEELVGICKNRKIEMLRMEMSDSEFVLKAEPFIP